MESADVRRLAMVLAVQAEIEGMKAANELHKQEYGGGIEYQDKYFQEKAEELRNLAYSHDDQL
jgi:hypothetical protein